MKQMFNVFFLSSTPSAQGIFMFPFIVGFKSVMFSFNNNRFAASLRAMYSILQSSYLLLILSLVSI